MSVGALSTSGETASGASVHRSTTRRQRVLALQCTSTYTRVFLSQVRYRKDLHMQNSIRKLKLTLTLVLTLTDTGGAVLALMLGYRIVYTLHGNSGHLQ